MSIGCSSAWMARNGDMVVKDGRQIMMMSWRNIIIEAEVLPLCRFFLLIVILLFVIVV